MRLVVETDDGARLAAEERGPVGAPAVLFLNSIGCDRRLWDAQVAALDAEFRCLVFDARGHGESEAPCGDYTIERLGRDALAVLDAAGAAQAHICGLSLGGLVGQWLAIAVPSRVSSLTLANTASRIGDAESWETRRLRVLADGLGSIADMAMERFFSEPFRRTCAPFVAEQRARFAAGSAAGYAGCCAALRDADLRPDLGRILARTLVIGGTLDVSTPPEAAAALAQGLADAALALLPAGHLSNLEQPQAFTAALRTHLNGGVRRL
jgi:3-oxoadipate enol-lactonase